MFPVNLFFFFHVTVFGLLLFRSSSIAQTIELLQQLLFGFDITGVDVDAVKRLLFFGWFLLLVQFFQYRKANLMFLLKQPALVRALFYLICFYSLIIYGESDGKAFIYFQF